MHTEKTTIYPYLAFNGNCREAMKFYKEALHGELEIIPFEGAPVEVPEDYRDKVMHASLKFGDAIIMASDGMPGQEVVFGNSNSISVSERDVKAAEQIFKDLSAGGKVLMEWQKTFWGAMFGAFMDKFGIHWMVNCELEQG